jgi:hypothetical protein
MMDRFELRHISLLFRTQWTPMEERGALSRVTSDRKYLKKKKKKKNRKMREGVSFSRWDYA